MTLAGTIAIAGSTSLIKIVASERIAENLRGVPDASKIVHDSLQSIDNIESLPQEVKNAVLSGFMTALSQSYILPAITNIGGLGLAILLAFRARRLSQ